LELYLNPVFDHILVSVLVNIAFYNITKPHLKTTPPYHLDDGKVGLFSVLIHLYEGMRKEYVVYQATKITQSKTIRMGSQTADK